MRTAYGYLAKKGTAIKVRNVDSDNVMQPEILQKDWVLYQSWDYRRETEAAFRWKNYLIYVLRENLEYKGQLQFENQDQELEGWQL